MSRKLSRLVVASLAVAVLWPSPAAAYTTRIHIALANELRESLITSGDGRIALRMGPHAVRLSAEDTRAIIEHPLEFRAGAIGPDNFVFPAMTDPTHAIGMRPFDQCELLYQAALTGEERAYALGCFLHGATDAVAHHAVNAFTGETFTLNPLVNGRQHAWDNVVHHIVTESAIQSAAARLAPERFAAFQLQHRLPRGFILRAYFEETSPLWLAMSRHARARLEAARAADPSATLPELVGAAGLAPAEQLVLLPVYLRSIDEMVVALRGELQAEIAAHQADAELGIGAGADGTLGTYDDTTACAATCPMKYARYFTCIGLLAPRRDASGVPLPPAFDVVADKLRADLFQFRAAYLDTVEALSTVLNTPITAGMEPPLPTAAQLEAAFRPMRDWTDRVTTIDYQTLAEAVVPAWILELERLLELAGVNVTVASVIELFFQPLIDEIEAVIEERVIGEARRHLDELTAEYREQVDTLRADVAARLSASAPGGLGGHALDHLFDSGLWAHSFNIAAAAFAHHGVVLPDGDELGGFGPASFDTSHTPGWMQAGACAYLREPIFPLGTDLAALLSVRRDGIDHRARVEGDSPVECHDGDLFRFAALPGATTCALVDLDGLIATAIGSVSRGFPAKVIGREVTCRDLVVPGLPPPPEDPDDPDDPADPPGGCCGAGDRGAGPGAALLGLIGLALAVRRRRRALVTLLALVVACSGGGEEPIDGGDGISDAAADAAIDADPDSPRGRLLTALGSSVWHAPQRRAGVERGYQLEFRAGSLLWAELTNPYGPARRREMRSFVVEDDGRTVHSTVIVPAGWPIDPENGRTDTWTLEVIDGSPRRLRTTRGGVVEEFEEGPWPAPTTGLTAIVYAFAPGGVVDRSFCSSGVSGFTYDALLGFARGESAEMALATDVVAGVPLTTWSGGNAFAVTDVPGFDRLGGTRLSQQSNFVVRYLGAVQHPGGTLRMRERDDVVEDGVWVFLGDRVGSSSTADLFLEVHGFAWADLTPDVPSATFPAGEVDLEAILYRCTEPVVPVDVELDVGAGFRLVGDAATTPVVTPALFPPAF